MIARLQSHQQLPEGSPPRNLRYEAPSATPREATSTQQAADPVAGRPHLFSALLPCPLSSSPSLLSYPMVECPTDNLIATSEIKLRLKPYRRPQGTWTPG
nr:unnamed protein product [Spirometra erinaceieuropaei]